VPMPAQLQGGKEAKLSCTLGVAPSFDSLSEETRVLEMAVERGADYTGGKAGQASNRRTIAARWFSVLGR
jgi:hypothetical protein